jgi:hypothetical protein
VTKIALPVLVLGIIALFSFSVTSQSNDVPDNSALRAEFTQKFADIDKANQGLIKSIDTVRAEAQRLSDDAKANTDKIAQTLMLRSDLLKLVQESKSSSDKASQIMLEQIDALRAEQVKLLSDAKEANDKAAEAFRQEAAASQEKLMAQVADTLKANTAASAGLVQLVDAIKKDVDSLKKNVDEDQQTTSNISPGFALLIALAALVLGPFLSYKFTENQLAAIKQQQESAAASQQQATNTTEATLAPSDADPQQGAASRHAGGYQKAEADSEKV